MFTALSLETLFELLLMLTALSLETLLKLGELCTQRLFELTVFVSLTLELH